MQVHKIQNNNYNPQFLGLIQIQNYKKGGNVIEQVTSLELDKGLTESALKNIFDGSWSNTGSKQIHYSRLAPYCEAILHTLGIYLPKRFNEYTQIEREVLKNGYSVKAENDYKITHIIR